MSSRRSWATAQILAQRPGLGLSVMIDAVKLDKRAQKRVNDLFGIGR
jgi:hypothetical protein